ncbi:MAG TPA: SDR family oxidoreductase, partial [Propionibacteriaceae bacterium]
ICVIGGSGLVGSLLLPRLAEHDVAVRAVARSASGRAAFSEQGFEGIDGDLDAPETLERAMVGCERLFLLSPPHPAQVTREAAAIDAARRAGVRHVVALSVMGADSTAPVAFVRWHGDIDRHLMQSGLDYTILRPAGFMPVHLWPVQTVKSQGRWFGMTGDGAAGFVDVQDVASVAAEVLTASGHEGAIYELTGPAAISMPEAAQTLGDVIGRPVQYVDLAEEEFLASMVSSGVPSFIADAITGFYQAVRAGHAATVSNSVQEVTGRSAHSYRDFATANQHDMVD